ncbi:MAG: MFS transporter [Elusimicrobiota bacterium]|jgi:hypothetical protein
MTSSPDDVSPVQAGAGVTPAEAGAQQSSRVVSLGSSSVSRRRVVSLYYGFQFFFPLHLWLPVFYEYQRRMGLSDAQIFSIQSFYYLVFCLFEIPTGLFADRKGYRTSLRAGALTILAANLLPVFWTSAAGFLVHFTLIALARSLVSGASNAYLYEYLKAQGVVEEYKGVEGKARAYGLVGKVVGWAGVGAMMQWHVSLPYSLSALCGLAACVYAWRLPAQAAPQHISDAGRSPTESGSGIFSQQSSGTLPAGLRGLWETRVLPVFAALRGSRVLLLLMLQGTGIFVLVRIGQINLYQPVLQSKSFSVASYGWIMSVMTLFEAWGSSRHDLFRGKLSDISAVFILTGAIAASLSLMAVSGQAGTVSALLLFSTAAGLSYPIQRQVLNDAIADSRLRATLLSVESILDRVVCAGVAPFIAVFVAQGRVGSFLHIAAAAAILCMAGIAVALRTVQFPAGEAEPEPAG